MSTVYLLHFDRRINDDRPTQHYIGHADDLRQRIRAHRTGRYGGGSGCAKLCAVAGVSGSPWPGCGAAVDWLRRAMVERATF